MIHVNLLALDGEKLSEDALRLSAAFSKSPCTVSVCTLLGEIMQ